MKTLFIINLVLMSLVPTICWSLNIDIREKDWEKSVYFCETTKRISIERDGVRSMEAFKFQMTVTREKVIFSEDSFNNLNEIDFHGMYNWWTAKNTYYDTTVHFNYSYTSKKGYDEAYFLYYSGSNTSPGGPYAEVTAIFADCYEFK